MHLYFWGYKDLATSNSNTTDSLGKNIQLCSATLTELYLDGLDLEHCFHELSNCAGFVSSDFKVTAQQQHSCACLVL